MSFSSPPELAGPSRGQPSLFGGDYLEVSESPPNAQIVRSYEDSDDGSIYDGGYNDGDDAQHTQDIKLEKYRDDRSVTMKYEHESVAPFEDSSSDEPSRPNRYYGPLSSWRNWTRHDRREVAALDAIRARDLSVHLYNAFALKRRARDAKRQSSTEGQDMDDSSLFAPNRNWTAWPMPADVVPRADEHVNQDQDDLWTLRGPQDYRPSAELEECLIAKMLKDSKERFETREWEEGFSEQLPRKRAKTTPLDADSTAPVKDESDATGDFDYLDNLRPVVQADDEKSKKILHPAARHVLTKFDELLSNLSEARQAYATMADSHGKEDDTEEEQISDASSAEKSKGSRTPKRQARERSRGKSVRAPSHLDATPEVQSNEFDQKRSTSRTTNNKRGKPHSRLGLRDWSDVLGIAAMTGFPDSAIMRASRRCADLFGEDMLFRTMDESRPQLERPEGEGPRWRYREDTDGEVEEVARPTNPSNKEKPQNYYVVCPVADCARHKKGFSRRWNLNQHLKIKHPNLIAKKPSVSSPNASQGT